MCACGAVFAQNQPGIRCSDDGVLRSGRAGDVRGVRHGDIRVIRQILALRSFVQHRDLDWLRPVVQLLALLPMAVPGLVLGLGYIFFFNAPGNPLNGLYHTMTLLVTCTIVHFYTTGHLTAVTALKALDAEFESVSASLKVPFFKTFWRVTLPNIKWGLLYGVILCNARAMGEFGAVSVVSGHIRGLTNTMPLHVEILYNEYNYVAAFAVASLLAMLALVTLALKTYVEWQSARNAAATELN